MRRLFPTLGLALAVLEVAAAGAPRAGEYLDARGAAEAVDRMTRALPLEAGRRVRIEATIADVTIAVSNRDAGDVEIVRRAPRAEDLQRFPAVIDDTGDPVRISALQPDEARDPHLKSAIVVRLPATTPVEAVRVFEGQVRLSGIIAGCDVDVRRGTIDASGLAGRVRLESGIGRIDLKDATLTPGGMLRLRVFNGPVLISFDRVPADGRILALTFNGTIASDIPLSMKDKFGPRFGEATLGTGEPVLSVDVVTGDISIRVRSR